MKRPPVIYSTACLPIGENSSIRPTAVYPRFFEGVFPGFAAPKMAQCPVPPAAASSGERHPRPSGLANPGAVTLAGAPTRSVPGSLSIRHRFARTAPMAALGLRSPEPPQRHDSADDGNRRRMEQRRSLPLTEIVPSDGLSCSCLASAGMFGQSPGCSDWQQLTTRTLRRKHFLAGAR